MICGLDIEAGGLPDIDNVDIDSRLRTPSGFSAQHRAFEFAVRVTAFPVGDTGIKIRGLGGSANCPPGTSFKADVRGRAPSMANQDVTEGFCRDG